MTTSPLTRAGVSVQKDIQEIQESGQRIAEYQWRQRKEKPQVGVEPRVLEGRSYPTDEPETKILKGNVEARVWRFGKGLKAEFRVELVRYHSRFDTQEEAWMFRFEDLRSAYVASLHAKKWIRKAEKRFGKERRWWD